MKAWLGRLLACVVLSAAGWAAPSPEPGAEVVDWRVALDPAVPASLALGARFDVWIEARTALPIVPAGGDQLGAEREAREALRAHFGTTPFGELDDSWVLVDVGPVVIQRVALAELQGGDLVARQRVRLIALEPGERTLPPLMLEDASAVELPTLTIEGYLGPDEDTARPPASLDQALASAWTLPEQPKASGVNWPLAGGVGAVCSVLLVLAFARRRKAGTQAAARPALLVLQDLAAHAKEESGPALQAAHFELTALVRAVVDERKPQAQPQVPGATDEEWLARRAADFSDAERQAWRVWFAECAEIKYGGGTATVWGFEARVKQALDRLQAEAEVPA